MKRAYLETIALIERLHRECLEMIKAELDHQNIRDINNVQAMILFNIGDEELTIGELTDRGYYLGSNVSYNVKKMTANGYLLQQRGLHDKRSVEVRLSPKANELKKRMEALYDRQVEQLTKMGNLDLASAIRVLRQLEKFWASAI